MSVSQVVSFGEGTLQFTPIACPRTRSSHTTRAATRAYCDRKWSSQDSVDTLALRLVGCFELHRTHATQVPMTA